MDRILIKGGKPLFGEISISGAKNAALPLLAASILTDGKLRLKNLPHLNDVASMINLLSQLGVKAFFDACVDEKDHAEGRVIELNAQQIHSIEAPYDIVRKMRASVLVLGPLLARCGEAKVSLPGGCAIGTRPINLHIEGFKKLGAEVILEDGYVHAKAPKGGLKGAEIMMPLVSVTGTENIMMAACLAQGKSVIIGAAREPEVVDLAECLNKMGAKISGAGTDHIEIEGVSSLHSAEHSIIADRIEMGTYAVAAAITGGEILIKKAPYSLIQAGVEVLRQSGVKIEDRDNGFLVSAEPKNLKSVDIKTEPFPGFPTDLQAQFMTLMTICQGASVITETIFENRFMHVPELVRMGADIKVQGSTAIVKGVSGLKSAPVMATDLRASSSLVLAGLAAQGETIVSRVYHLDRGYEHLEEKLSACGADILRIK